MMNDNWVNSLLPKMDFKEDALRELRENKSFRPMHIFASMRPEFRDDEEIVMEAVRRGASLKDVSPRLRKNKDVVLEAIKYI